MIDEAKHRDLTYDGWIPPPAAGELLKMGGGSTWFHCAHGSNDNGGAVRALLAQDIAPGYVPHQSCRTPAQQAHRRSIRNLRADLLAAEDWMDLSYLKSVLIPILDERLGRSEWMPRMHYNLQPSLAAFPEGTTGFFYVHVPHRAHPIGAQLRFRVVPRPDPAEFAAGHDLRLGDGSRWHRWVPAVVRNPQVRGPEHPFLGILARQGLVARAALELWQAGRGPHIRATGRVPVVCPGAEPFLWDLALTAMAVRVGHGAHAVPVNVRTPFGTSTVRGWNLPYTGACATGRDGAGGSSTAGAVWVELVADPARERYDMRIVRVGECTTRTQIDVSMRVPVPEEGALVVLSRATGRRLWAAAEQVRAESGESLSVQV
jgi:hypothetical protein